MCLRNEGKCELSSLSSATVDFEVTHLVHGYRRCSCDVVLATAARQVTGIHSGRFADCLKFRHIHRMLRNTRYTTKAPAASSPKSSLPTALAIT
jgi:hypothetical protein